MEFIPLYFADRLHVINPHGDVGVVTCWAKPDVVIRIMRDIGIDMDAATSRVAVVGNLYGGGMNELIRNLLYNPQIRYLLIVGPDLSGAGNELFSMFDSGLYEDGDRFVIAGTKRKIAGGFDTDFLFGRVACQVTGKITDSMIHAKIAIFFMHVIKHQEECTAQRVNAPLPAYKISYYPSNPSGHQIVARRPLDAWRQAVHRIDRYGVPVTIDGTKQRKELLNLKVVVTDPRMESEQQLSDAGFTIEQLKQYQYDILDGCAQHDGVAYSYGRRLRAYFKSQYGTVDTIKEAILKLSDRSDTRGAYITLWDNTKDGFENFSSPCLVSLFFRVSNDKLTLTATYRVHNVIDAWVKNVYGLMAIQEYVADAVGIDTGSITVISHSISINLDFQDSVDRVAAAIADIRPDSDQRADDGSIELAEDACGAFIIEADLDAGVIVADLTQDGDLLVRYTGKTSAEIERQIARDRSISLLSHALYVGRELAKAEAIISKNR